MMSENIYRVYLLMVSIYLLKLDPKSQGVEFLYRALFLLF